LEAFSVILAVALPIFIAELTDKDALLLIALSTRVRQSVVFVAGLVAFTITTSIVVSVGQLLVSIVPVVWVKIVGALIMIGYGFWQVIKARGAKDQTKRNEEKASVGSRKAAFSAFLGMVWMLAILDLAGDATVILTIVLVAQFQNAVLVFVGAMIGLAAATGLETSIGKRLGKILSPSRISLFSAIVFFIIGAILLITAL
jgi:putative Ca2+/H+ antiporter (TMEM165/GDT1 family)